MILKKLNIDIEFWNKTIRKSYEKLKIKLIFTKSKMKN